MDLPRTKCQNYGCDMRARFYVGGTAGWYGHHCYRHTREVVAGMLKQAENLNRGIVILPFCKEAQTSIHQMLSESILHG